MWSQGQPAPTGNTWGAPQANGQPTDEQLKAASLASSKELLRGQTKNMVAAEQVKAGAQWRCDLLMGVMLGILVLSAAYRYFVTDQYVKCDRDLAMWSLVDGLNLLPVVILFASSAYAKYKLRSDEVYLTDSKHAEVDCDPEASARVLKRNVAFLAGERLRNWAVLVCFIGWIAWDLLGLYWWSTRGKCDPKLASSTVFSVIAGLVLFSLMPVIQCYKLMTTLTPENTDSESDNESA